MAELVVVRVSLQIAWGLLSNRLAKGLKQGNPSDEALRKLLLDKFQKLHEELNSLRRKELVAAVSFMENGYELFLKDTVEAKKEFGKARDAAQMAFGVVSETTDKLLATKILLASAMHEFDDKIDTSVSLCLKYMSRLNSLPEIVDACSVYLKKGLGSRFKSITGPGNRLEVLKVLSEINRNVWEYVKHNDIEFDEGKWPSVQCSDKHFNPVSGLIPVRECQDVLKDFSNHEIPIALIVTGKRLFIACSRTDSSNSSGKSEIKVINLGTSEVQCLSGHSAMVLTFAAAQGKVFSGSYDRSILVWDACSLNLIQKLGEHDGAVRSLVTSKSILFSGGTDMVIKAWDVESLSSVAVLQGHEFPISILAFKHHLFSYAPGEGIRIWNVSTWNVIGVIPDPGNVSSMFCSLGSKMFVHCGTDIRIWNLGNLKEEGQLKDVGKVSVEVSGMKVIGVMGENIHQHDLSTSKCLYNQSLRWNDSVQISVLHFNHDLGLLFLGGKLKQSGRGIVLCM